MKVQIHDNFQPVSDPKIAVVGLGYVGLPLACLLASKYTVLGFDINTNRVNELAKGVDRTGEVVSSSSLLNPNLTYTSSPEDLGSCDVIIVAVPTPVDEFKRPDLTPLVRASITIGSNLRSKSPVIVFESTVYPGVTEEVCGNEIAAASGRALGNGFFLGYSPERINPGDKQNTIEKIKKVVSGNSPKVASYLGQLYGSVIKAGVHIAPSIRVAEAAKVIENTQRDVNIALINELAMLFERIGVDTQDVLDAARTKWNFLDFRPGLVGGHCIGVDPYYLTHLASKVGHHCLLINSGRRINDDMAHFIAEKTISMIMKSNNQTPPKVPTALICGVTFKENVPDTRNTKVIDLANCLEKYGVNTMLYDPVADRDEFFSEYSKTLVAWQEVQEFDAVVLAVKHKNFASREFFDQVISKLRGPRVVVDIKGAFREFAQGLETITYWTL